MKLFTHMVLGMAGLTLVGCADFVDIKTQGAATPNEIKNYRYLLNNSQNFSGGPGIPDIASDDIELVDGTQQVNDLLKSDYQGYWMRTYKWEPEIYPIGQYQKDAAYDALYNSIIVANVIINEAPASRDGNDSIKNEVVAEARVHRADAYLMLVNMYAKPYTATSASTDLGMPIVLESNTTQSLKRPPLQENYDLIIDDLTKALPYLPETQQYNTLPCKASAYAELARTYLCMGDYEKANENADKALETRSTLNDLSTIEALAAGNNYPTRLTNPEILLSKIAVEGISAYTPTAFRLSQNLLDLLGTKDKRYTLFTTGYATVSANYADAGGRYFYQDQALGEARNIGPTVPEMMLIKAEYYARSGDAEKAMEWVNKLRVKRFSATDYVPMTATDGKDALKKVIDERHREFFCRMLRWWDMRRLNNDPDFQKTLTRTVEGKKYTLAPNSERYVFKIAPYQITLNPEMQQNP